MLAILSAPGSRGDVNPMIAIGHQLRRLGMDVVISISESYADVAESADLDVEAVISRERFESVISNPNVWKPIRGARAVMREMAAEFLPLHYEVIRRHHRGGQTILVSHPLDVASRVFRELDPATPLFDVHLAPAILRIPESPARLSPWWFELSRPAWAVRATYWLADRIVLDPVIAGPLNKFRVERGLTPISRVMDKWWLSPDRILAMYPEWFAPQTARLHPRLIHAGFPLSDADDSTFVPATDRPIVFTAGTAHRHSLRFFERAVNICLQLRRPGLLLSMHAENIPPELPATIRSHGYVSLRSLLPHCAAIVHHGGIGTTSQALAAGVPQVIRPMAFDQFDNASRVESLRCGVWLKRDSNLADALTAVLESELIGDHCRSVASRLDQPGGAVIAAQAIQEFCSPQ